MARPFTQWQCELAVWLAGADGWPTDTPAWIGSCTASMEGADGFEEEAVQQSGSAAPDMRELQERHTLSIENLWTADGSGAMPGVARGQRFVTVAIWTDDETGRWVRRQYHLCRFNPFAFDSRSQHFTGKVEMAAGWFTPSAGTLAEGTPSLVGTAQGLVQYRSASGDIDLFSYPLAGGAFTPIADTVGRATITAADDGTHVFAIAFAGVKALGILPDGTLQVASLSSVGGSAPDSLPALEFRMGARRIASLSAAGVLTVPGFRIAGSNPGVPDDFELRRADAAWLASLTGTGLVAQSIDDTWL